MSLLVKGKSADGEAAVFQVDETGAKLHDAEFKIFSHGQQIAMNPDIGIAIDNEPVYTKDEKTGGFTFNKSNAAFYVSIESGDAYFKGTVQTTDIWTRTGKKCWSAKMITVSNRITSACMAWRPRPESFFKIPVFQFGVIESALFQKSAC